MGEPKLLLWLEGSEFGLKTVLFDGELEKQSPGEALDLEESRESPLERFSTQKTGSFVLAFVTFEMVSKNV